MVRTPNPTSNSWFEDLCILEVKDTASSITHWLNIRAAPQRTVPRVVLEPDYTALGKVNSYISSQLPKALPN